MVGECKDKRRTFEESVEELLSALGVRPIREEFEADEYVRYNLTAPETADYVIFINVYDDTEIHIGTVQKSLGINDYFWYCPFEATDPTTRSELIENFHKLLKTILTHETRVRVEKGHFFWSYFLDYNEGETWHCLYSHANFNPKYWRNLRIPERKSTCSSPAYF